MRALELVEYNRFEIAELPIPVIANDEILVRVKACGICGSDVHGMDGSTGRRIPPIVMGHEAAGEVASVGKEVFEWKVGDRVTFDSTIYCGACQFCQTGQVNLCDHRQVLGVSCADYRRQGAFAEYVAVPARVVIALPEGLSYERAAWVEPVSVAVHGVKRAQVVKEDRVVVIGVGMIGILIVQVLKAFGVSDLTAVDIDDEKLSLATELGANKIAKSATEGEFDVAIEAVGVSATVGMAIKSVKKNGRVSLVGNFSPDVQVPLQVLVTREISVFGSCASQGDYAQSLELIADGRVKVDPILSAKIRLEEAPKYFAMLHAGTAGLGKVIVCP
jgi:L-iditol 2-dehydrogenase